MPKVFCKFAVLFQNTFSQERLWVTVSKLFQHFYIFLSFKEFFVDVFPESIIKPKKQVSSKLFLKCQTITNDKNSELRRWECLNNGLKFTALDKIQVVKHVRLH